MRCIFRPVFNSLGSIWYCLLVVVIQTYLLFVGISRYTIFTSHDWSYSYGYDYGYPTFAIATYIALHVAAITLAPIFIGTAMFKTGNLGSDGDQLGDPKLGDRRVVEATGCCKGIKSLWQHCPPVAQTIHLMMAFCLLMAQSFIEGEIYRYYLYARNGQPNRKSKIVLFLK